MQIVENCGKILVMLCKRNANCDKFSQIFSNVMQIVGKFRSMLCKRNVNCGKFSQIFSNVM